MPTQFAARRSGMNSTLDHACRAALLYGWQVSQMVD